MAELRALCAELGWTDVQTYIQSGNVLFEASDKAPAHEAALETAIEKRFSLAISVMVRTGKDWRGYLNSNPFPEAAEKEPNRLMLGLTKEAPKKDAAEMLQAKAQDGEQVRLVGGALWIHFGDGSGTSKLSPALLDRLAGSPVTMRNWRTVLKLQEMLEA